MAIYDFPQAECLVLRCREDQRVGGSFRSLRPAIARSKRELGWGSGMILVIPDESVGVYIQLSIPTVDGCPP